MTNPQSNNNTANTINQNTTTQGTSNAMQFTDMGTAIAAALNISLAEDTGESSNMNLDSAAPMETEGRGGDPNTELEIMEITREDDANTNNEGGDKTSPKETSNAKGKHRAADRDEEGASGSEEEGADPNTEPEIMEITREDALNTNTEGGEKSAPKKSSKAKGKKKATGKDGEGEISGAKKRVTEKKMTHAIKEVKKTSIQEFMEHIWGVINKATLGYALMTVMDDNDLGTGPTIQCCQVNIRPIDPAFLEEFAKGVSEHGLHNTWQEHAMDVGVHRRDIDLASLQPAKDTPYSNRVRWQAGAKDSTAILYNGNHRFTYMHEKSAHSVPYLQYLKAKDELCTASSGQMYDAFQEAMQVAHKVVRDGGIWLIRFFDLDFIDAHKDRALIESHLAANAILPVHQDTTSQLGRILRDRVLFDAVFDLFQYEHFRSWDNTGTGLSICNIYKWLPTIGGAMIYISQWCSQILHFLATPIDFVDVDPTTPEEEVADAFLRQYNSVKAEFEKSLPLSACQVLDKRYFKDWTDIYVKMVGSSEKEDQLAPIEFFGTMQMDEAQNYSRYMSNYWDAMVAHAERERDSTIYALHHGLMGKILGDKFADQLPVPTKVLMYTLGEQLRSIEPAIREVVSWIEPLAGFGLDQRPPMWRDHLRAMEHFMAKKLQKGLVFKIYRYFFSMQRSEYLGLKNYIPLAQNSMSDLDEKKFTVGALGQILDTYVKACHSCALKAGITVADAPARLSLPDLEPPEIIEDELEPEQFKFLEFVSQVLCHTSFPWMDSTKLKKSDTLLKKLVPLYKSYRARHTLLGTDVAWRIWHTLTCVLMIGVQKKDKSWRWEWLDGFSEAPEVNAEEKLDHVEGALQMKQDETESNLNVQTQQYLQLRQRNHDKLKLIIRTALSPEFGLGLGDRALPKAHELVGKLVDELKLCSEIAVHRLWCPTEAFTPESQREMDILYPLDIPDPMSAEDTRCYKDKQLGSGIASLSSLPTFDNAAKDLWVAEKKATQAEEQRQLELLKQHEKVKVVQSARAERVAKVAEMRRARKIKSAPIILDSDEEGVDMEGTAPKAGTSNTPNASTARPSTPQTTLKQTHEEAGSPGRTPPIQTLPWLPLANMAYSWEGFKTIAKQANPDIAFKELPALLYLLLMVLDMARSKPEAKSKVESIIQMVDKAQGMPDAQMILGHIVGLQGLGRQASKYVKKAQELVTEGTATGMISVKEAAQWFE
ncbi:hypothetical protein EDC04DRAFT_2901766 [Pisolithus marmoratus]|nr:hypothetical protein EDC04DRAFT_2901766 [Pisolithus marmoratus]